MKKIFITMLICLCAFPVKAEDYLRISSIGACVQETFDGFCGTFGSLSNGFSVCKDAGVVMTNSDPDFKGISSGGVNSGGCYAWQVASNSVAIGFQPIDTKFTPGSIDVLVTNASNVELRTLSVSFDFLFLNNADRSSSVQLAYSVTNGPYQIIKSRLSVTPLMRETNAVWVSTNVLTGIQFDPILPKDSFFRLRWTFDDSGGAGSRDESGIDNVRITADCQHGTVFYIY